MFHHFSWVRTKEEMLKKVRSWGHKGDRNWIELVEKEFSTDFQKTDFIHGYQYKIVEPLFNIRFEPPLFPPTGEKPHVVRLSQKDLRDLLKFKRGLLWNWLSSLIG